LSSGRKFIFSMIIALAALASAFSGCSKNRSVNEKRSSPTPASAQTSLVGTAASPTTRARRTVPPAPPAGGSGLQPGSVQPTAPGKYTYNESGGSAFNCGRPRTQQAPTPTSLVVDPEVGSRQRTVRDRRGSDGQGVLVTADFEFRPEGIHLVYLHQQQSTPIGDDVFEFKPDPLVMFAPKDLQGGQSWQFSLTSTDGQVKLDVTNIVETADEAVTIGDGSDVSGSRVRETRHWTGRFRRGRVNIEENFEWWISLSQRLVLKRTSESSGFVGGCTTNSREEERIVSTTPS
jgi:hypothetical protein